ncbi:MAG TPA: ECF transporter S component, partial [Clostridiaceae bacterium]|nr:ECF transporter S component [Clostridiaceae bacterium]
SLRGQVAGIIAGSFLKYIFLYFSATRLITLFAIDIPPAVVSRLAVAMGSIQFITALFGGVAALAAIRILRRRNVRAF